MNVRKEERTVLENAVQEVLEFVNKAAACGLLILVDEAHLSTIQPMPSTAATISAATRVV